MNSPCNSHNIHNFTANKSIHNSNCQCIYCSLDNDNKMQKKTKQEKKENQMNASNH